jgi:hypothetical protein
VAGVTSCMHQLRGDENRHDDATDHHSTEPDRQVCQAVQHHDSDGNGDQGPKGFAVLANLAFVLLHVALGLRERDLADGLLAAVRPGVLDMDHPAGL